MQDFKKLTSQAKTSLSDSLAIIQEVSDSSDASGGSAGGDIKALQLTLQYRLDTQDALAILMQMDRSLLQVLGIEPQHSSQVKLERLEYALGNNDLRHILFALSQLVHSLTLMAHRYQQQLDKGFRQKQKQLAFHLPCINTKLSTRLQKAVELQKHFIVLITAMKCELDQLKQDIAVGPIFDHIAALRGPVSQFFQAIQNGLELTHRIYEKTKVDIQLEYNLGQLLEQAEAVLQRLPTSYQAQHFFTPSLTENAEQLEKRAANKRLGHVFRFE